MRVLFKLLLVGGICGVCLCDFMEVILVVLLLCINITAITTTFITITTTSTILITTTTTQHTPNYSTPQQSQLPPVQDRDRMAKVVQITYTRLDSLSLGDF